MGTRGEGPLLNLQMLLPLHGSSNKRFAPPLVQILTACCGHQRLTGNGRQDTQSRRTGPAL